MVCAHNVGDPVLSSNAQLLYRFQPLDDPRWPDFLHRHPRSSVFHTAEWLTALRRTYGYEPIAITTSPPGADLQNAVVFCSVESFLTGRRLVSLPFADHCDPLLDAATDWANMVSGLGEDLHQQSQRYIEIRPTHAIDTAGLGLYSISSSCLHQIDLRPDLDTLFRNCHKSSTQRKIRRARREGLVYEEGRSPSILDSFYRLLLLTRRRHCLPPQPKKWFHSLIDCFGVALKIRVALKDKQPVAAVLTLRHKDTLLYKYGCSDAQYHNLGGVHLLLWESIREAKQDGLGVFDLGRSEWNHAGLITFKDRWGAKRSELVYLRLRSSSKGCFIPASTDWKGRIAMRMCTHLPDCILCAAGGLIYKHVG